MKEFKSPYKYQGGWVSLLLAAGSMVLGEVQGSRSRSDARRARALERKRVRLSNALARRDLLKGVGQAEGAISASGASDAGVTSSGVEGSRTALTAQTIDTVANTQKMSELGMRADALMESSASKQSAASMWQAFGSIAGSEAGSKAIDDVYANIFKT